MKRRSNKPYLIRTKVVRKRIRRYNPAYGDDRVCECGHPYHRHFDTYEKMDPCGCKYCRCRTFKEAGDAERAKQLAEKREHKHEA